MIGIGIRYMKDPYKNLTVRIVHERFTNKTFRPNR